MEFVTDDEFETHILHSLEVLVLPNLDFENKGDLYERGGGAAASCMLVIGRPWARASRVVIL